MYRIELYETRDGYCDVSNFLESLRLQKDHVKDARIQYKQIVRYIELLQNNGLTLPNTIAKHLQGEIWELRPGNNRILFFAFDGDTFVLLHLFRKKTQKTPKREIEKAFLEIKDYYTRKDI